MNRNRLSRFNSIDQDVNRTATGSISNNFINCRNNQDPKKIIQTLQKIAKEERQKRQQIEQKYQEFAQRNFTRQKQFYKILAKFDSKIQKPSDQDIHISQLYKKILQTFNAFNEKARQLLEDRYSELYRLMERRIDILMQKMDKQLSKYRKLSQNQLKQMRDQIKQMAVIAAQIQNQNVQIRKRNETLQLKNKLLNQEKKLLLQQIVFNKCKKREKIKKSEPVINITTIKNKQNQQKNKDNLKINDFWNNLESIQFQNPQQIKNQKRNVSSNRTYRNSNNKNLRLSNDKKDNNLIFKTFQPHSNRSSSQNKKTQSFQSTIIHLKSCLQRQKHKNHQLIKFSLQLQTKQQKIKQLIKQQIQKQKTKPTQKSINQIKNENNNEVLNNLQSDYENLLEYESKLYEYNKNERKSSKHHDQQISYQNSQKQKKNLPIFLNSKKQEKDELRMSNIFNQINKILYLPQSTINTQRTSFEVPDKFQQEKNKLNNQAIRQKLNQTLQVQGKIKIKQSNNYKNLRYINANLSINYSSYDPVNQYKFNKNNYSLSNKNSMIENESQHVKMDITRSINI